MSSKWLQWRHMDVMASQITGNYTVCSMLSSGVHQREHQNSVLLALCGGKRRAIDGFPSQKTRNAESVACHNATPRTPFNTYLLVLPQLWRAYGLCPSPVTLYSIRLMPRAMKQQHQPLTHTRLLLPDVIQCWYLTGTSSDRHQLSKVKSVTTHHSSAMGNKIRYQ